MSRINQHSREKRGERKLLYEYACNHCGERFDKLRPMAECSEPGDCPMCGQSSPRSFSMPHVLWGWILTEASHHVGAKDEFVQDKPSNAERVDRSKAPYIRTYY